MKFFFNSLFDLHMHSQFQLKKAPSCFLFLFSLLISQALSAQSVFTFNNSGNTNWSTVSWVKTGDATTASYPGENNGEVHHVVITGAGTMNLDASVINTSVKQVVVTAATLAMGANSLTINDGGTGLTGSGTVTLSTGTLIVAGNVSVTNLNASGGAGTVEIAGNFTTTTYTSGASSTLVFNGASSQTTNGYTFRNLQIATGASVSTTGNVTVNGDILNNGLFDQTANRFTISSTADQAISGSGTLAVFNLTVSSNARTVTLGLSLEVKGTAAGTNANGTDASFGIGTNAIFNAGSSTITMSGFTGTPASMAGGGTFNTTGLLIFNGRTLTSGASWVFANVQVNSGRFFTTSSNLTVNGNLTNNDGSFAQTGFAVTTFGSGGTQTISCSGSPTFSFQGVTVSAGTTLNGSCNLNINATYTNAGAVNFSAGTVTFTGGSYSLAGSGTNTFNNMTISAGAKTLATSIAATGDLNVPSGTSLTFDATGTARNLSIGGNATIGGTINAAAPGTATNSELSISGTSTITGSLNVLNGTNRVNLTLNDASYSGGSAHSCNNLTISGTVSYANTAGCNVGGDFLNNGSFTATAGRLTLLRTSAQSIGGTGSTSFFNLTISDNSRTVSLNHPINIAGTATGTSANGTDAALGIATAATFNTGAHTVTMIGNPGTPAIIAGNGTLSSTGLFLFDGNTRISATKTFNNIIVNSTRNLILNVNISVVGDLDVQGTMNLQGQTANRTAAGGAITAGAAGTLILGGSTTFPTNYSTTNLPTGSLVTYNGGNQIVRTHDYSNLRVLGGGTKTLGAGITTVGGTLTLDGAIIVIGANQLNLTASAALSITSPSATNHINATGAGEFRKYFDAIGSFTVPMGTGSVHTPALLNLTSATFGGAAGSRYVGLRCLASKPTPQLDNTHSLNKHWAVTSVNISSIDADLNFTYVPTEANALTESLYRPAYYNGSAWTLGSLSEVASNVISFTKTGVSDLNGNYTAGPNFSFVTVPFYSRQDSAFNDPDSWSLIGHAGAASIVVPTVGSQIEIGNSNTITLTASLTRTFNGLTVASGCTLDLQNFSGFSIGTLAGTGTIRLFANSGTAIFPTVTTNNFATTSGSVLEFYGTSNYSLPGTASNSFNLQITGSSNKTLGTSYTINGSLTIEGGNTLFVGAQNIIINGSTNVYGAFSDNAGGGTNTFNGLLTIYSTGSVFTTASSNNSPFVFGNGLINNGFFNKTGTGNVTFTTSQTISGSRRINIAGATIAVNAGFVLTNNSDSLVLANLTLNQDARLINTQASFTDTYTGFSSTPLLQNNFDTYKASNDVGNNVVFVNQNTVRLSRAGAGIDYAVRTTNINPSANLHVAQFTLSTTNTGAQNGSATIILGSGFADNDVIHAATARLQVNYNAASGNFSVTHPDGTPTTSGAFTGTQTITWVINRSGSALNYTNPSLTNGFTLGAGLVDVWVGGTRFAAGLAMQNAAQDISQVKIVVNQGNGTVSLGNLILNPVTTITTSSFITTCIRVTPTEPYVLSVPFTTAGATSATHFNTPNIFRVQLSNAAGSFASVTTIGTLTTTETSGTILATIPGSQVTGNGYRIRVVSTSPISGVVDNGSNLVIERFNVTPFLPVSIIIGSTGSTLTANGPGITSYQWAYSLTIGGGVTDLAGRTSAAYTINSLDFPGVGTYLLFCKVNTSGPCGNATTNYIPLYINCPVTTNLIVNGDFTSGNSGFTSDYNFIADNPVVNNELVVEGRYGVHNNPREMHNGFCVMASDAVRSPVSGGNMLMGNAANVASDLWRQSVTVQANKDYVFSFYATSLAGTPNTVYFGIFTSCYQTGANLNFAFETSDCQWTRYTYQFNSGTNTELTLAMRNITTVAFGNDLAIDDIQMYECAANFGFTAAEKPVWRGATADWNSALNWGVSCSTIDCNDDYELGPVPVGNVYPIIDKVGAVAGNLTILSGANMTLKNGFNLDLCGDLVNTGVINAESNSTITMTGTKNPSLISGLVTGASRLGNIIINKTSTTDTVRLTTPVETIGNFTITNGRLKTAGFPIQVAGNFENSSHFLAQNGTVSMIGNVSRSITMAGTGNFHDLRIEKELEANTVSTTGTVTVDNQLNLLTGKVVAANPSELYLSSISTSAVINQSESSYVIGRLRRAVSGTGAYEFPLGDATRYQRLRMDITSPLTGTNWVRGFFDPNTAPGAQPNITDLGQTFIYTCDNGYWDLTPNAQPSAGTYNIRIYPTNIPCTGAYKTIAKRDNNVSPWTFGGSAGFSDFQRNGFTSFSEFAQVSSDDVPLPVSLKSFVGWKRNQWVELEWTTMSEVGFEYFEIERSTDGMHFSTIGKVNGAGTQHGLAKYNFTDQNPFGHASFYRLRQVDLDGKFEYSRIIKIDMLTQLTASLQIYPNPLLEGNTATLFIVSSVMESQLVRVSDLQGKMLMQNEIEVKQGNNTISFSELSKLPQGAYLISIYSPLAGTTKPVKWVVQ